jgi:DNA-binding MurR/RpiR family transcriptional regulator
MEQTVMNRIESHVDSLTKLQKKVANYVLSDPIQAAFMTVDQLAHSVGVSTATVVRLSTELEYGGYTEFQRDLQEYLKSRAKPSTKLENSVRKNNEENHIHDTFVQNTDIVLDNISKTYEALSELTMESITERILSANDIYINGIRSCEGIVHYLGYNLNRMLKIPCNFCDQTGDIPEHLRNMTEDSVVIAVTMARYSRSVVEFASLAKKRGACVIAITDSYTSPLSGYANYQIVVRTNSDGFHNSITAACYVVDVLLSMCCKKAPERIHENLKATEKVLSELNFMME